MVYPIRVGSTAHILKMRLLIHNDMDYKAMTERLLNAQILFSMVDEKTGKYKIANKPAYIEAKTALAGSAGKENVLICYKFSERELDTAGYYRGEFAIRFLDCDEQAKVPVKEKLYINILDTITDF